MAVKYPVRGSSPWDITLKKYIDSVAASGGSAGLVNPMQFGAVGDGEEDDTLAVNDCFEFAAEFGSMVIIHRPYGVSDKVKHYGGMSVLQTLMPKIKAVPDEPEVGLIALSDEFWYQYGDGSDGSGSANDNPGPIRGLHIDGAGIAGGGDGLFVMDAAQSSLYDLQVNHSIGTGVHVGRSQNCNFFNPQVGACNGTAVLLKALVAGQQGPGHNLFFGGHLHDNYVNVEVAGRAGDFFPPHDNVFAKTLLETGRVAGKAVRVNVLLMAGQTQFDDVNLTYGGQVGIGGNDVEEDCAVLIDNPDIVAYSTVFGFRGGSIGGGLNEVTDGVRTQQSGAANEIRLEGRVAFANVGNEFCNDGIVLGGADPIISNSGVDMEITAAIEKIRVINGATTLNTTGRKWTGNVLEKPASRANGLIGNPYSIQHEGETGARFSQDWDARQRWTKREAATVANPALPGYQAGGFGRIGDVLASLGRFGIGQSFFWTPTVTTLDANRAVVLNWEISSYHIMAFTTDAFDVTSVTFTSTTAPANVAISLGQHYLIGISASEGVTGNTINWAASGIHFNPNLSSPQPIEGEFQHVLLIADSSGAFHEAWRSHGAEGGGGGGGGGGTYAPVSATLAGGTYTVDPVDGTDFFLTVNASTTLAWGGIEGDGVTVTLIRTDGTDVVSLPGGWLGVGDVSLSTAANGYDVLTLREDELGVHVVQAESGTV